MESFIHAHFWEMILRTTLSFFALLILARILGKKQLGPIGMISSFIGIAIIAFTTQYWIIIIAVLFIGFGSAIFHPEGSRVSFMAAGSKRGLAQSIYQVGGNSGQALAPLISAYIFDILGQRGAAIILVIATFGIILLSKIATWYKKQLEQERTTKKKRVLVSTLHQMP